jgi:hypothetical protein
MWSLRLRIATPAIWVTVGDQTCVRSGWAAGAYQLSNDRFWRKADLRPNWHVAEGQQQIYPSEHNSVVTLKPQIALLLNSDLADAAPDGMIPAALTGGHDG